MIRVKFETLQEQKEFFNSVKEKLSMGGRRLARKLGFKSRCTLENYIVARRAPPLKLVKELERISGTKAPKYIKIKGKVYRKRKEFIPLEPDIATRILKERFKGDFDFLVSYIKSDYTIKDILEKMRLRGYHFDTSKFSRCVGSYRINLLSKIVNNIIPKNEEIIILGSVRKGNKSLELYFSLLPLLKILDRKRVRIGLEISKDRKRIRIFPLNFGRNLIKNGGSIKIIITEKSGIKIGPGIEVILDPNKFNFNILDSIYDKDARILAKELLKRGFVLDSYRSTPANRKGDLSLYINGKNIIIEITRGSHYKIGCHKLGQSFIQKIRFPKSIQFLVCKKKLLSKDYIHAFKRMGVKIINVDFNKNWKKEVIKELEELKNEN